MNKLEKKLKVVRTVFMYGIEYTHIIRELYQADEIVLKESSWYDNFKTENPDMYPLDLKNTDLWITYKKCADLEIEFTKLGKIIAYVRIHNGYNMDGSREELRWDAKFVLSPKSLVKFKDQINYKFEMHLEDLYDEELKEKKRLRMKELGTDILKNL